MKYFFIFLTIFLLSCNDDKLIFVSQKLIEGKVSAVQKGYNDEQSFAYPKIWVQSPTQTEEVTLPMGFNERWKVGDSCLLIIQVYKEKPKQ